MSLKPNTSAFLSPHLRFFGDDQLDQIHFATLEILERVGVQVDEPEALELLATGGAFVEGNRARIPSWMVEDAVRTAPSRVALANRDGKRTLFLEKNQPYFGPGSDLPYTIDIYTGRRRHTLKSDVENAAKVADALPNIDFMMSLGIATDVPAAVSDLHQFEAMVTYTKKPVIFTAHHRQGLLDILEMAAVVAGSMTALRQNPFVVCYAEPISPLHHSPEGTQKLLTCAERGIPVVYTPGLMAGATGPVTLAGAVATANAELLSGLVIHQLKKKGAPFIYGGVATIMDMKTTLLPYGSPEWHMNSVVLTQLSRKYGLPVFSTGGCTDSCALDGQAAIEMTYSLLLAGLSGANLIHDVGYLEAGLTQSLTALVMCDEIIDLVRRIIRSYEINPETLAVDVVEEVGPSGHFVTHEHTNRYFRQELWMPRLFDRRRWAEWSANGSKTLEDRAAEVARQILERSQEQALGGAVAAEMKTIIAAAERRSAVR